MIMVIVTTVMVMTDDRDNLDDDGDRDHGEEPGRQLAEPDKWSVQRLSRCKSSKVMQCNTQQKKTVKYSVLQFKVTHYFNIT